MLWESLCALYTNRDPWAVHVYAGIGYMTNAGSLHAGLTWRRPKDESKADINHDPKKLDDLLRRWNPHLSAQVNFGS
jgi:hypothetical protein